MLHNLLLIILYKMNSFQDNYKKMKLKTETQNFQIFNIAYSV